MSAPTKCEKCGAKATFAIQAPCVIGCGGLMYYDKTEVAALRAVAERVRDGLASIQAHFLSDGPEIDGSKLDDAIVALRHELATALAALPKDPT